MKIVKAMPFLAMGTMALGLVGVTVLAPVANADDSASAQQTVQVTVGSHLSIKLTQGQGTVTGNLDGKESAATKGEVEGNPANGFTVKLADADNDTNLRLNGATSGTPIPAADDISETSSLGWSVVLKNGSKKAMPAKNSSDKLEVAKTDGPSASVTKFDVAYTFKADNSIPSGTYSDLVEYTVVSNQ